MSALAFQITSFAIVYSTIYSVADQRKHQSSASLAVVRGIRRWTVNSPHKWPVTQKMFPFDDVIMTKFWLLLYSSALIFLGRTHCPPLKGGEVILQMYFSKLDLWIYACDRPIGLMWLPQKTFDDRSTLVQVMAWCRQAPSHYLTQCQPNLCHHMTSLDHNESKHVYLRTTFETSIGIKCLHFRNTSNRAFIYVACLDNREHLNPSLVLFNIWYNNTCKWLQVLFRIICR